MRSIVAPSLLAADFAHMARDAHRVVRAGAAWLHIDVMDGHYVPNLTLGPAMVQALRREFPRTTTPHALLDCHLMVTDADRWLSVFAQAGADQISFHIDAVPDPATTIRTIHGLGMRASAAVSPDTNVQLVVPHAGVLDQVLIMTVRPGFGGQSFMTECLDKVRVLRRQFPQLDIQVDGGLDKQTVHAAAAAGANVIVAGTSVFRASDADGSVEGMVRTLRDAVDAALATQPWQETKT